VSALLGKLVIHKRTGVFGEPVEVFAPGECPPNANPELPTPSDVFVVQFREGHKFMLSPSEVSEAKINEVFDVLTPSEKIFVDNALGAIHITLKELGILAATTRTTEERSIYLTAKILRESARVLER